MYLRLWGLNLGLHSSFISFNHLWWIFSSTSNISRLHQVDPSGPHALCPLERIWIILWGITSVCKDVFTLSSIYCTLFPSVLMLFFVIVSISSTDVSLDSSLNYLQNLNDWHHMSYLQFSGIEMILRGENVDIKCYLKQTDQSFFCLKVEKQRRLERIKQKQSQLQELILQVQSRYSCL